MGSEKFAPATRFAVIFAGMRRVARGRHEVSCELLGAAAERMPAG